MPEMFIPLFDARLEVVRLVPRRARPGAPPMVFLHEALGSVSLWRGFPQRVADATGCEAIVYSRHGFGRSTPRPEPYATTYMHEEALVWLPALLDAMEVDRPFLFGHSDGGSIALIAAGGLGRAFSGLVVLAPHVMVEEEALAGIRAAVEQYRSTDFAARLARHHDDPEAVFRRWPEIWQSPAHRAWNIEEFLPRIACPVVAVQGEQDEYATMDQVCRVARGAPDVRLLELADCGHSPHRDRPDAVIHATVELVDRVAPRLPSDSAGI
jgi:pimeloyl-ACP methyl ester carboxylesterase